MAKEIETQAPEANAAKLKALQATIDKIEKDFGKGTIIWLFFQSPVIHSTKRWYRS